MQNITEENFTFVKYMQNMMARTSNETLNKQIALVKYMQNMMG